MTIEELTALTNAELKTKADNLGIEYSARATKQELVELIHAQISNQKESPEVAQADETDSDDGLKKEEDFNDSAEADENISLGNGFFIVPNQMVKVRERQENGELTDGETSLDDLLAVKAEMSVDQITKLESDNKKLTADNEKLTKDNKSLTTQLSAKDSLIETLKSNSKTSEEGPSKHDWGDEATKKIRVRIVPNKDVVSRMRAGLTFTNQYSEIMVDEKTFGKLAADKFLQIEILEQTDE